ncbi:MAG: type I glyceraldehyde-3-phosphate dehydrogenase [Bifidobacteriaceae bacterium]|jgi:glyceraldehyde 3-phosphate dehydrogenase|nr:type I glyceraldehyde-3-phosphate dehydrogenase [Bifidobacteriaceae bacterium]
MTVKIGINGFGRIGRLAFRRIFELQNRGGQAGDIEVAAINDLTTPSMLAYLLKYDSTHGTLRHDDGTPVEVTSTDTSIIVDGKEYTVYAEKDARNIPWVKNDGVDYVLECTGFYTSAEKSQAHIDAGAKKVLISAPAKDDTTPTVVYGVNHEILKASDIIVSAGSCTTNSLAAMVQLLDNKFGLKAGFMTTIHAYTGTQMILDGPRGKNGRANRAAAINTIEHSTGAAKAIGKVVPSVDGKVQGHAQRVAVPDGSVTELTSILSKKVTIDEINDAFKAEFSDKEYFGYNADGIVSSDIIGDTHGGVFDPTQTDVNQVGDDQLVRTVSFYDNENGFTCNMIRTLLYFAEISEK